VIGEVLDWFTRAENWRGSGGIPARLGEHLLISGQAMLLALLVALPIALTLGHLGRGGFLAINISNVGRAVPSFALLVLFAQLIGIGQGPAVLALTALAIPPIITNTYVGVREVEPEVREAARGMGLSGRQVLTRVELPLATPLILAGVRTAAVQVVATATLAALVASGGLGRFVIDGLRQSDEAQLVGGALLVAALALLVEISLGALQKALTPADRRGASAAPGGGAAARAEVDAGQRSVAGVPAATAAAGASPRV